MANRISRSKALNIINSDNKLTEFQKKVYRAALSIDRGQVRTYKWLAHKIGIPKAYRAVGQALKHNPYTITVPCHRIVKSDGSIGGYSKGIALKKKILSRENPKIRYLH